MTRKKRGIALLTVLKVGLAIITIILAVYSLIMDNTAVLPYALGAQGLMLLLIGIEQWQKGQTRSAYMSIAVCIFIVAVLFWI